MILKFMSFREEFVSLKLDELKTFGMDIRRTRVWPFPIEGGKLNAKTKGGKILRML